MRSSWQLARSTIAGRKGRFFLLVAAVTLAGTLAIAAAAVLGTVHGTVRASVGRMTGLCDLTLRHRYGSRVEGTLLDTIRRAEGVERAAGRFKTFITISNPAVRVKVTAEATGIELEHDAALNPAQLKEGRLVRRPDEIVVDGFVADRLELSVGDVVLLSAGGGFDLFSGLADRMLGNRPRLNESDPGSSDVLPLRVVGIVVRPRLQILQRPSVLVDLGRARGLAGVGAALDLIQVKLAEGFDAETFRDRHERDLPRGVRFQTAAALSAGSNRALGAIRVAELILNVLVMMICAFLVVTGLTTAVDQSVRELAIFRCIGAGRWQIAGAQFVGGMILTGCGALASVPLGLLGGYLICVLRAPELADRFTPDLVGVAGSVGATLFAGACGALYPAVRAAAVRPLEAFRWRSRQPRRGPIVVCVLLGAPLALCEPLVLVMGLDKTFALWFYLCGGLAMTLVGYLLLSVPASLLAARIAGPPLARVLAVPGALLRQTINATPWRHGFTGASLMLGVALLVAMWTSGRSLMTDWFSHVRLPDAFVHSPFPMPEATWQRLREHEAVGGVCPTTAFPVRLERVRFGASDIVPPYTLFASIEPDEFFRMTDLQWIQGDAKTAAARMAAGGAVLVSREYLVAHGIGVGSRLGVVDDRGAPVEFEVAGVVTSPGLDVAVSFFGIHRYFADASVSTVVGTRRDAERVFGNTVVNLVLVRLRQGQDVDEAVARLRHDLPGTVVGSARSILRLVRSISDGILATSSLLAVSMLLIAGFGVGHIIIANLSARRMECGVLRAVGASRGLLGRLIAGETLLIAVVGAALGVVLGIQFAMVDHALMGLLYGVQYELKIHWPVVAVACAAAVAIAMLAALPAIVSLARTPPRDLLA
jgi:putative ABC transport system permease protein